MKARLVSAIAGLIWWNVVTAIEPTPAQLEEANFVMIAAAMDGPLTIESLADMRRRNGGEPDESKLIAAHAQSERGAIEYFKKEISYRGGATSVIEHLKAATALAIQYFEAAKHSEFNETSSARLKRLAELKRSSEAEIAKARMEIALLQKQ